jgi:hypothetical protein
MLLGAVLTDRVASLARLSAICFFLASVVKHWWWGVIVAFAFGRNVARLRRANFDLAMEWLGALFGMPMFAYLLLRSKRAHANGNVMWKGRTYGPKDSPDLEIINHTPTPAGRFS